MLFKNNNEFITANEMDVLGVRILVSPHQDQTHLEEDVDLHAW